MLTVEVVSDLYPIYSGGELLREFEQSNYRGLTHTKQSPRAGALHGLRWLRACI